MGFDLIHGEIQSVVHRTWQSNENSSIRMTEEYVTNHFYLACYLARNGHFKEASISRYQAYWKGLTATPLLKQESKNNCDLRTRLFSEEKRAPLHEEAYHERLPFKELVENIKPRAIDINYWDVIK